MRVATVIAASVVAAGLSSDPGRTPQHYSYVGKKCAGMSGISVVLGGAEVGAIQDPDFPAGASCAVIPPTGVSNGVALRCYVDNANTAHIVASTAVAIGVSVGAATWCVEVRDVSPNFIE